MPLSGKSWIIFNWNRKEDLLWGISMDCARNEEINCLGLFYSFILIFLHGIFLILFWPLFFIFSRIMDYGRMADYAKSYNIRFDGNNFPSYWSRFYSLTNGNSLEIHQFSFSFLFFRPRKQKCGNLTVNLMIYFTRQERLQSEKAKDNYFLLNVDPDNWCH